MSRGAGLGRPPTLGPVIGQETNHDQTGSVGMGTFGKDSGKHHPVSCCAIPEEAWLNIRMKGVGRRSKVFTECNIPMETLRTTLFHPVQSPNPLHPRPSEYPFQLKTRLLKIRVLNSPIYILLTTTTHFHIPKPPKNKLKLWQKLEPKLSLSYRRRTIKPTVHLLRVNLLDLKVRDALTKHRPVVPLSVTYFTKTEGR